MARARSRPSGKASVSKAGSKETAQTESLAEQSETQTKGTTIMAQEALTPEQIAELMQKGRTKGAGEKVLQSFLDSQEQGIVVDLTSGPLAGKNATSAVATLNNAIKRTRVNGTTVEKVNPQFENILVKKAGKGDDAKVALINTELVNVG